MDSWIDFNSEINEGNPLYSFYDLSFLELLTINQLVKLSNDAADNKNTVLRHDLYKMINDLVKSYKTLSTSSFYRSIKKLEERGFLESKKSENVNYRNAIEVYPTPMAVQIMGFMVHFLIQFNQDLGVLQYIENNFLMKLGPHLPLREIRYVMVVDPSIRMSSSADQIISILPDAMEIMQLMARLMMLDRTTAFSVNPLPTDRIFEGVTQVSDLVIFPLYEKNAQFQGLDHLQIIEQVTTIIREDGYLLIIHLEELKSDHHYVDIVLSFISQSPYFTTFDSHLLIDEVETLDLEMKTQFSYHGVSFILFQLGP